MKIEIPAVKKFVFEMVMPIRWGDMDAMGHVNNTVYFRYMETARVEWMRAIDAVPDPKGPGPVIVNAFCNFYTQQEYPADVLLQMSVRDRSPCPPADRRKSPGRLCRSPCTHRVRCA